MNQLFISQESTLETLKLPWKVFQLQHIFFRHEKSVSSKYTINSPKHFFMGIFNKLVYFIIMRSLLTLS